MTQKKLSSLEYTGLEALLERMIHTYEEEYETAGPEEMIPAAGITLRTPAGIEIAYGTYDFYYLCSFSAKSLFVQGGNCIMAGSIRSGEGSGKGAATACDVLIDVTEFLDSRFIDLDRLYEKIQEAGRS